jgi:prophage regulatory protein
MERLDIVDRLRVDPGQRTIGQLLQDREAALHEIVRLRVERDRLLSVRAKAMKPAPAPQPASAPPSGTRSTWRPGSLIQLKEVCGLMGVSRSTIYKWVSDGHFPAPVRIGARAVRWNIDAIEAWRAAL